MRSSLHVACVCLMLLIGGCDLVGALTYKIYGPPKIPAKYKPEKTAPMLVLAENARLPSASSTDADLLARYVGGDAAVLSGLMTGADSLKRRPFVVDVPEAYRGKGRVILFANNPIYRWQNHGEFNMVFNSIMNWNDLPRKEEPKAAN